MNEVSFFNNPNANLRTHEKLTAAFSDCGYMDSEGYLYVMQRGSGILTNIFNYFAIENEILKLNYISDVSVFEVRDGSLLINVVPKQYCPYSEVKNTINRILEDFRIVNSLININIVQKLDYTLTGKVKFPSTKVA